MRYSDSMLRVSCLSAAAFAVAAILSSTARADEPPIEAIEAPTSRPGPTVDTTYGRIEGDLGLVAGVGATFAPHGPRATLDLRFRYLESLGAFFTYEDGKIVGSGADPRRAFVAGLEVRPLFLGRWLKGLESGHTRLDLTLDSLGLELGAVFSQPFGGSFSQRPGIQLGLGVETPILPHASGPWIGLHGGVRWSDTASAFGAVDGASDRAFYLSLTVSWHQIFGAHVVDFGDRANR